MIGKPNVTFIVSKNDNNLISQNKHLLTTDQNMIPLRNYIINWR